MLNKQFLSNRNAYTEYLEIYLRSNINNAHLTLRIASYFPTIIVL